MLHLSAPLQPSSRSYSSCASSPTCLCLSCASSLSPTTEHSSSKSSVQHNDRPLRPHIDTLHIQGVVDNVIHSPSPPIDGHSADQHRGHDHPLNTYAPWPQLIQLEPVAAGSLSDLLAFHSPPTANPVMTGPWTDVHATAAYLTPPEEYSIDIERAAAAVAPLPSTPRNPEDHLQRIEQRQKQRGPQTMAADTLLLSQSQEYCRQNSQFLSTLGGTRSCSCINIVHRRSCSEANRLLTVSTRDSMIKSRPLQAALLRLSKKSMVPGIRTTTTRPRMAGGVRLTTSGLSSSSTPVVDVQSTSLLSRPVATNAIRSLPSCSLTAPPSEAPLVACPAASAVLPCSESTVMNQYAEGSPCALLPVSTRPSHSPQSPSTRTTWLKDNTYTLSATPSLPSDSPSSTSFTKGCRSARLLSSADNNVTLAWPIHRSSEAMLLSSKKDVSTRVRDEDDEEEELINIKHVHCDSSGQPGTVTEIDTAGATLKCVSSAAASPSSDKGRMRYRSMVSEFPSSSQRSSCSVPVSLEACIQNESGGPGGLFDQGQDIRRARPTRTVSASEYHPDISSTSFSLSPSGSHRRSRPTTRSSFFFSPCDLSTDSSPGSEQEDATADYRAKATPLVSRFQALGDDRHPSSATTSRPCRSRCQSASMTDPLSEASMSSLHVAFSSSLSMSSDSFSTFSGSLSSTPMSNGISYQPQESHHPSILPFSTMVDLATAKAENITGLYFAKQMNANLRRSLPSLRTSMASTPSPPFADRGKLTTMNPVTAAVDTNELDLRTESQPGSPMTPFPGPSPEQHDYPFAFANRSALTSSLSAPSAIHIQITSSSPSPVSSRSAVAVGGCEPAREKPLVMKGKRMAFEQGHPVEMNSFAQLETHSRAPVAFDSHSSLPPLPPTQIGVSTSWADSDRLEEQKYDTSTSNSRRTRVATCSGSVESMARNGKTALPERSTNISHSLPMSSSMSSLAMGANACGNEPTSATQRKGQHRRHHSASHFFHLSSLRQHSPAQFNLALCYEHGQGGVSQDLGKAIHFYQQAAAQGHSKASYNLGCIYFHRGLVHKAIGWFELASKCRVRDLETIQRAERDVDKEEQLPQQSPGDEVMRCPPWKANYLAALSSFVLTGTSPVTEWSSFSETSFSLSSSSSAAAIQDLLEQLHGPSVAVEQATVATSGPTAPYLPAMLTLALLCYQGVPATTGTKTTAAEAAEEAKVSMKDGHAKCTNRSNGQDTSVFLRRNSKQAILVLKKLITIAPSSLVNGVEGSSEPPAIQGREKSKSSTFRAQDTSSPSSSSYSTSCPNLPTPSSTVPLVVKDSVSFIGGMTGSASDGEKDPSLPLQPTPQSNQRSFLSPQRRSQNQMPFTTSTNDNARHCRSHPSLPRDAEQGRQATQPRLPPMPQNIDDHEAWAVCLARHLLQYWQQQDASSSFSTDTASAQAATSAAAATPRERIQRYHLLHMTNPTNSKMLYNLGLVYDMYLNAPAVASRCYLSAYEKSVVAVAAEKDPFGVLSGDSCATSPLASFTCSKSSAITRINSAWNLGVLYAKDRQWAVGRDWFLRVQQELMTTTPTMATDSSCVREKDTHRAVDTNNIHLQSDRPRADALLLVSKNQQHRPQQARQIQRELRTDAERVEAVLTLMDQQLIQENVAR